MLKIFLFYSITESCCQHKIQSTYKGSVLKNVCPGKLVGLEILFVFTLVAVS